MKISTLLEREPFEEIFKNTLESFLTLFEPEHGSICVALKSVLAGAKVIPAVVAKSDFYLDRFRWENIFLNFHSAYFDKRK
jgi:hypothetical protein